jgi:hypothetical protein
VQLVGAHVAGEPGAVAHPDLADDEPAGVVVEHGADHAVHGVDVVVVEPRVRFDDRCGPPLAVGGGRAVLPCVREVGGLAHAVGDVDAEAVDPAVEPEPQRLLEVGPHFGVRPVQVRLLGGEQVQVPLPGAAVGVLHPGPGRSTEDALPVVGRFVAALAAPAAEVVAAPLRGPRCGVDGRAEPLVLAGRVVRHEVDRDAQAVLVGVGDEAVERGEVAEHRVDVARVRHVVAVVGHR